MEDDPRFLAFVHAVAEGVEVDWDKLESGAADDSMRATLRELRLISRIADFHQDASGFEADSPGSAIRTAVLEPPDRRWGPLRLIELVGHGSFGHVWRAYDERLDREVALKLLKDAAPNPVAPVSRIIEEARLLARVRHLNVVTVYGAEQIDGAVGLWMEFIRGRSMEQILRDQGPFSPQEATTVGLDLCGALSAVHRAGLVHRDIKAHNVMREAGGRVVLMDFGSGASLETSVTTPGPAGTPLYIAPEVFAGQGAKATSDIYSLGVLLYHLVTAAYPIHARTLQDVHGAHRSGQRVLLRDARPDLPAPFVRVVERCLEADPLHRYQSAGELERDLASTVVSQPATAVPTVGRRRGWLVPLTGVAVVIVTIVAANVSGLFDNVWTRVRSSLSGTVRPVVIPASATAVRKIPVSFRYNVLGRPSFDGRYLPYVAPDGNLALYELTTGQNRPVTVKNDSPEQAGDSVVSPDGRRIAYAWFALDGAAELRLIQTDGKTPHVLLRQETLRQPSPVEWSRDGTHVLALLGRENGTNEIALIGVDDGSVRVLKTMRWLAPHYMSLSPDGRFVVYDLPDRPNGVSRDIFIVPTDGGSEAALITHPANDVFPAWTPDGDAIFFASDRSGSLDVWKLSLAAGIPVGPPDLIKREVGRIRPLGVTAQGDFYYQLQVRAVDVYVADVGVSSGRVSGEPRPVSSRFVGQNISPEWSPDGSSVAYVSMRGLVPYDRNSRMLTITNLDTGEQRDIVPELSFFIRPRWSPDGTQFLVKGIDFRNRWGVHLVDPTTGQVSPAVLPSPGEGDGVIGAFEWSPDGRAIWYERAKRGLISRDLATGRESQLFDYREDSITRLHMNRGFQVSPDGRWLAVSGATPAGEGGRGTTVLKVRSLAGGGSTELVRVERPLSIELAGWSRAGSSLLFARYPGKEPTGLWSVPATGGEPQDLGLNLPALRDIRVHPEGRRLAFTAGYGDYELWVMQKFLTADP
jgi:serine/threonine protein kinase/WD40 repeat protein